jgi:hypothetical protein
MTEFALVPDEQLPVNERLVDLDELVGHTIIAAFDCPTGKDGACWADVVLVTQTGCFLTLGASSDNCGEDPTVEVHGRRYGTDYTLHHYVKAHALYSNGVINAGERDLLQKEEDALTADRNARRADQLRAQLAALTGSAA